MRILIAEDDEQTGQMLREGLARHGHEAVVVDTGPAAVQAALASEFDVIVLDRMLPALNGIEVLRRLRMEKVRQPVLMLTALGGIVDRVEGLEAGADDYLIKPFAFEELVARLHALARRPPLDAPPTQFVVGDIRLDLLSRDVTRNGRAILLQPREFSLLELLMRHAGRIVTRRMFLEQVWGFHFDPQTNIVESHLSRLRGKLKEGFADDPIETIRGEGYRLRDRALPPR